MAQFVLNTLTLLNINRFSKFFHCRNQETICNNIITKDPTTPQVCRYTTLWNVRKSWFLLACQEWVRLASSSSRQEPRLTANITVNMFSVAVYYLTSVQDASATPGPCSRTAHRHTLLETHWPTVRRENVTFIEPDMWTPNSPDLNPVDYAVWGALQQMVYQRQRFTTINQLSKAGDRHWVGQTVSAFWSRHWSVASPAWDWVHRPAARRTHWTFDVKTAWCDSYFRQ